MSAGPDLLAPVGRYYAECLAEHGPTPRGVDWNGEASQSLRFAQLLSLVDGAGPFSLNDLGCGYGALVPALAARWGTCDYLGIDLAPEMVAAARALHADQAWARFEVSSRFSRRADYAVASGIFNVRLDADPGRWETLIGDTLDHLHESSLRGFAFNCLTSYSDPEKQVSRLHYADPLALFDRCKRRYSRHVALLHDYGLYEFTLLVRKVV